MSYIAYFALIFAFTLAGLIGIYYAYKHLRKDRIIVSPGDTVQLEYHGVLIWGRVVKLQRHVLSMQLANIGPIPTHYAGPALEYGATVHIAYPKILTRFRNPSGAISLAD